MILEIHIHYQLLSGEMELLCWQGLMAINCRAGRQTLHQIIGGNICGDWLGTITPEIKLDSHHVSYFLLHRGKNIVYVPVILPATCPPVILKAHIFVFYENPAIADISSAIADIQSAIIDFTMRVFICVSVFTDSLFIFQETPVYAEISEKKVGIYIRQKIIFFPVCSTLKLKLIEISKVIDKR